MVVFIAIFGLLLVRTLYQWKFGESEYSLSGGESFPSVAVALYGVPFALVSWAYWDHSRMESDYARAASALAGRPAYVQCETFFQAFMPINLWAEGYAHGQSMFMRNYVCRNLSKFVRRPEPENPFHNFALIVFAHETMHVAGEMNEAMTECMAMQRAVEAGRLLGAGRDAAHAAARSYYRVQYSQMRAQAQDGYWSAECAPGRAMDLRLPDAPWD